MNRNWPNRWGKIGVSHNPQSEIYAGPFAGSEPEINGLVSYIKSLPGVVAGADIHSYGEFILRNYGWTARPCAHEEVMKRFGDAIADHVNSLYGEEYVSKRSGELYPAGGAMDDWMYEEGKFVGMTWELRDKGRYGFLLPPDQIVPTGEELVEAVLTLAESLSSIGL